MTYEEFMSKDATKNIKGVLVCMVLLSHLSARVELFSQSLLGTMFSAFGYLAVSVFFFLSAFGLYERYMQEGSRYVKSFFLKKILPYYAMCSVVIFLYLIRDLLTTQTTEWFVFFQSFLYGKTIVDMGWYLQAQLLLYVIFFCVFLGAKKRPIWYISVLLVIYCVICAVAGLSTTWYEGILCFPLGLFFAKYKQQILCFLGNPGRAILSGIALIITFLVTLWFGNKQILPEVFRICIKMLSTFSFNGLVIIIVFYIRIGNPVTRFLGKYSFEMYVTQGLFLNGLRPVIKNDWLYMLAATAGVLALSLLIRPLFRFVNKISTVRRT